MERGVADGELRPEHAVHPCGRAKNSLVGQQRLSAANEGAVAARNDPLLVAQDDMAAVRSPRNKEGEKLAVDPLDMSAPPVKRLYRFIVERLGDGGQGFVEQTSRRLGQ